MCSSDLQDTGGAFYLGARSEAHHAAAAEDRFNGSIDEAMVFDRALPGSELKRLYDAGAAGTCPDDLVVQLDSPVGQVAPLNQVFPVTLRVVNVGVTPASGVVLTNLIPALLEVVSTTNSQGTVTAGDGSV